MIQTCTLSTYKCQQCQPIFFFPNKYVCKGIKSSKNIDIVLESVKHFQSTTQNLINPHEFQFHWKLRPISLPKKLNPNQCVFLRIEM